MRADIHFSAEMIPFAAIAIAVLGWLPLFLAAGLAQGSGSRGSIAASLAIAGGASVLAIGLATRALVRRRAISQVASAVAFVAATALGIVTAVFVFSFRW